MGHKVHPKSFRLATIYNSDAKWFSRKKYAEFLKQDFLLRKYFKENLKEAGLDSIQIERGVNDLTITLIVAKPGLIIGRGGVGAEELRKKIQKKFFISLADSSKRAKEKLNVKLNIQEVNRHNLSAAIVLQNMIADLEKRMPFRRVLKQTVERVRRAGAAGVKVMVSGRLDGAEIARTEKLTEGRLPLQNLRADIDFASGIAKMNYGVIGVKVWIYRGEVFVKDKKEQSSERVRS